MIKRLVDFCTKAHNSSRADYQFLILQNVQYLQEAAKEAKY